MQTAHMREAARLEGHEARRHHGTTAGVAGVQQTDKDGPRCRGRGAPALSPTLRGSVWQGRCREDGSPVSPTATRRETTWAARALLGL